MQITTFKDMYIAELQELVNMEDQLADILQRSAEIASHPSLQSLFKKHRLETMQQGDRVRSILQKQGAGYPRHVALIGISPPSMISGTTSLEMRTGMDFAAGTLLPSA